jgi:hypothetical protein
MFTSAFGRVRRQQPVKFCCSYSQHRPRLTNRSYSNDVSPDLSTFRTVFHDTGGLLDRLALIKCSRRIRAIVSTISIPNHLLR